jgi:membrane associated rhomboid family serine protease
MATEVETCFRHPDQETRVHCTRCGRPICPACMTPAPVGHHCPVCVAEERRSVRRVRAAFPRPRSAAMVLLGINAGVFVVETVLGGSTNPTVLVGMGAMVPALVAAGEYWRLVTAMFLHIGLLHLMLNSLGLYIFGNLIEQVLGTVGFVAIYLVAGFVASVASFAFGSPVALAAGASGAIFGPLGAWLAYNLRRRSLSLARANVQGALLLIAINVVFGLSVPGIDNLAHIGGLAAGVAAGFLAEGVGRRAIRTTTTVAGLTLMVLGAAALAAWRAASLSTLPTA